MKKMILLASLFARLSAAAQYPQQDHNTGITFLNHSVEVVTGRFEMLISYQSETDHFRRNPDYQLRLPSSGPLERFYYEKAAAALGFSSDRTYRDKVEAVWKVLNQIDETAKSLETYVRLRDYQKDNLQQSDALVGKMLALFETFNTEKQSLQTEIQLIYRRYQPYKHSNPYLNAEKLVTEALLHQEALLASLSYYLNEENPSPWPADKIRESMLADEIYLKRLALLPDKLAYPASSALGNIIEGIQRINAIKRDAIDNHNFAASQSAAHGNQVYLSLLREFNQDLVVMQQSFADYAKTQPRLLYYPAFVPLPQLSAKLREAAPAKQTPPFTDKPSNDFKTRKSPTPAKPQLSGTLNQYMDLINESLRQMHLLQLQVRNYERTAGYYRDPDRAAKRAPLEYSHKDFKVPAAEYALLVKASASIPESYRASVLSQAEVLMDILKEMDALSIELVGYTAGKTYLTDHLTRSDAIIARYRVLFNLFDERKEKLYRDVRRIHESYPNAAPASSWYVAGNALLQTMDDDHKLMFSVRDWFRGQVANISSTGKLQVNARQLIADEYANMKGLQRYGRSNGLCPYSPYEDLAENSLRFAEKAQTAKMPLPQQTTHPFESFYYFYNNELVYEYNKFVDLAKAGLLKMINQPNLFLLPKKVENAPEPAAKPGVAAPAAAPDSTSPKKDITSGEIVRSLEGFAPNNMVLLLDVSSSMNSPAKMPLLKRSIKSLLALLRPEDQISIVIYSGRARVVLKPTSGSKSAEIARMVDLLQSDGDTDGNEGIKLAYKTATKNLIPAGNNRIVLATDGEFPVSAEVLALIEESAAKQVNLSVFTFGKNEHTGHKLKKLSDLGRGSYTHVTEATAEVQLIIEAQGGR